MKFAKRMLALLSAGLLSVALTATVSAEKFVETLTDDQKSSDATLAEEYRSLFQYKTLTADGFTASLDYRLYVPEDYDANKSYPVILFLHGAGESNDGSNTNEAQLNVGMMNEFFTRGYYKEFPCIIIAPQVGESPSGTVGEWVNTSWKDGSYEITSMTETCGTFTENIQLAKMTVDETAKEYNVDMNRIYVTGISMGGYGTWNIITHYSDYFAAAMPICGAGDPSKADYLKDLPIWCFHGDADSAVPVSGSREMYDAIDAFGQGKIRYTEWTGEGHTWTPAYMREDVWTWLFSQSKTPVDTTELSSLLESAKAMKTDELTAEEKTAWEDAVAEAEGILDGTRVKSEETVTQAVVNLKALTQGETETATGATVIGSVVVWILIAAGALVLIAAVVVIVLVKKKK